jgi:thiol-disulfide isomerase/thioredoxin
VNRAILFLLVGLLAVAGGWVFQHSMLDEAPATPAAAPPEPADLLGARRPDFTLGSTDGSWVSASDFDGQVLLINFWATWCVPCRAEMPMLSELHQQYAGQGLRVLGIALDDVQPARDFVTELGIAYPVLVGLADVMATSRAYGNRDGLLPYSVLVDRDGVVRWSRLGELTRAELLAQAQPLL